MRLRRFVTVLGISAVAPFVVFAAQSAASAKATCNNSNPLLIGVSVPLTGTSASNGLVEQQGVSLGFQDANAAGGALGRCVKEDLVDDQASPTVAAQTTRQLVDQDHVQFVVGPEFTAAANVALPLFNAAKVINVSPTSLVIDAAAFPYTFGAEINGAQQAATILQFMKARKLTRAAVLYVNNATGQNLITGLNALVPASGVTLTAVQSVNSGTPDDTPQMTVLKNSNPQVLISGVAVAPDTVALISARNKLGWNIPTLCFSSSTNPGVLNTFSAAEMKNVYAGQQSRAMTYKSTKAGQGAPTLPQTKLFVAHEARALHAHGFHDKSLQQPAAGYDQLRMIVWAINGAKSTDADKVKAYFESHAYVGARGKYVWSPTLHAGIPTSSAVYAYAKSVNRYGLVQIVPGQ